MRTRALRLAALAVIAASALSCDNAPSPTTPIVFVGPAELVVTDLRVGTGATLATGQVATVHYGLWLYDPTAVDFKGTFIEDSRLTAQALSGVSIRIQAGSVIQGWVQGMPGTKVGGIRRLLIPPGLAYGSQGSGAVPGNAWLVFDVDLLAISN